MSSATEIVRRNRTEDEIQPRCVLSRCAWNGGDASGCGTRADSSEMPAAPPGVEHAAGATASDATAAQSEVRRIARMESLLRPLVLGADRDAEGMLEVYEAHRGAAATGIVVQANVVEARVRADDARIFDGKTHYVSRAAENRRADDFSARTGGSIDGRLHLILIHLIAHHDVLVVPLDRARPIDRPVERDALELLLAALKLGELEGIGRVQAVDVEIALVVEGAKEDVVNIGIGQDGRRPGRLVIEGDAALAAPQRKDIRNDDRVGSRIDGAPQRVFAGIAERLELRRPAVRVFDDILPQVVDDPDVARKVAAEAVGSVEAAQRSRQLVVLKDEDVVVEVVRNVEQAAGRQFFVVWALRRGRKHPRLTAIRPHAASAASRAGARNGTPQRVRWTSDSKRGELRGAAAGEKSRDGGGGGCARERRLALHVRRSSFYPEAPDNQKKVRLGLTFLSKDYCES